MRTCKELGICQDRPMRCADCHLPSLRESQRQPVERHVPLQVPALLRTAGVECAPGQAPSVSDADWEAAKVQLMRWVRGGGRVLLGLVRRRKAEANLL